MRYCGAPCKGTLGNLGTDYKFTGQREEASLGIYFFNARWMDPSLGRFTSPDTIVPTGTQGTQAWDRYAFVNNNPVRYNDPTGHQIDQGDGETTPCDDMGKHSQECLDNLNEQMENYHNPEKYDNDELKYGLTPEEIKLLSNSDGSINISNLVIYLALGKQAESTAQELYEDDSSGDQNAFQHAYWGALLAQQFGGNFAREATKAHEYIKPNNKKDAFKDLYNNEVGIQIGQSANAKDLASAIMVAVAAGETLNLDAHRNLVFSGTPQ